MAATASASASYRSRRNNHFDSTRNDQHFARTQIMTHAAFERTLQARRAEESLQNRLQYFEKQNALFTIDAESEARVAALRRLKRQQEANAEMQFGNQIEQSIHEKQSKMLMAQQDEALAAAMAKMKAEKIAQDVHRKRVCEASSELQELKAKLAAAELNKTRSNQLQEHKLLTEQDRARKMAEDKEIERDRLRALELEKIENERQRQLASHSKQVLEQQMQEKERAQQVAYEEFLKEKEAVDEVVRGLEAEDAQRAEKQRQQRQQLQNEIRQYLESRIKWRADESARAQEELRKIQEYQALQQQRYDEIMRQKQKKTDMQDAVLAKLTAEIAAKRREEEEMRQLLEELYQEEAEQKALAELRQREDNLLRMRKEMLATNEYMKKIKAEKIASQQKEEAEITRKMLAKFAEDQRIEQMNAERRRRELLEYRKEIDKQLQTKRELYQQSVQAEIEAHQREQAQVDRDLAIIEEERQHLLSKYASQLHDHLPKGVFKNTDEFARIVGRPPDPGSSDPVLTSSAFDLPWNARRHR